MKNVNLIKSSNFKSKSLFQGTEFEMVLVEKVSVNTELNTICLKCYLSKWGPGPSCINPLYNFPTKD
jgi:hypothetical protein